MRKKKQADLIYLVHMYSELHAVLTSICCRKKTIPSTEVQNYCANTLTGHQSTKGDVRRSLKSADLCGDGLGD